MRGREVDEKCIFLHFLLRWQQKPIYLSPHFSLAKCCRVVLAECIINTASLVAVPPLNPSQSPRTPPPPAPSPTPWKAQTPGELQTLGNYPPSYRLLLHYLCIQHHWREGWTGGVGAEGVRGGDGWKCRGIKVEGQQMCLIVAVCSRVKLRREGKRGWKTHFQMSRLKKQFIHFLTRLIYMSQHMYSTCKRRVINLQRHKYSQEVISVRVKMVMQVPANILTLFSQSIGSDNMPRCVTMH